MPEQINRSFTIRVKPEDAGNRLDAFLTTVFPELSRNIISGLIRTGAICVAGSPSKKPSVKIHAGDIVSGSLPGPQRDALEPEPVDLNILFEDQDILIINKPPGLVVHPAPGHLRGTLVSGLLYHCPQIQNVGADPSRPGIVHRLDKDTSGILIIAKTDAAYHNLAFQFKARATEKIYLGIVFGVPDKESGQIVLPIGRHPTQRKKMQGTDQGNARHAETRWKIREAWSKLALMEFDIKTGRTHQIRVHCAAIRHPIVGDPVYGPKRPRKLFPDDIALQNIITAVPRQMLHAWRLGIAHPRTDRPMAWEAPFPEDMIVFSNTIKAWLENTGKKY